MLYRSLGVRAFDAESEAERRRRDQADALRARPDAIPDPILGRQVEVAGTPRRGVWRVLRRLTGTT